MTKFTDKLRKKIGLTDRFFNRKKKANFSLISFIRWAFRNYGKAQEAEYKPRFKRYFKVEQ